MTSTLRATQFAAYLAEMEAYIAENGHLPAQNRATPRTDKIRLQRKLDSKRTDSDTKARVRAVLSAPSWQQRRKAARLQAAPREQRRKEAKVSRLDTYLAGVEAYVSAQGHLPSSSQAAVPRMKKQWLLAGLASPATDAATKERITALLGSRPYKIRSAAAVSIKARQEIADSQLAELAEAASAVNGFASSQLEVMNWILQHRRLPSNGTSDPAERKLGMRLGTALRTSLAGTCKASTARFVLAVPNLAAGADRDRIRHLAETLETRRAERIEAKEAAISRLGSLEDRWDKGFADLSAWVAAHGTLPRRRTFDAEEYRLSNWLNVQRVQLRADNLAEEYVSRLRTIPGALEPQPQLKGGDLVLARSVADFHAAEGRLPRSYVPAPEGTVGLRLQTLRGKVKDGTIDPAALEVLSAFPEAFRGRSLRKSPRQRLADLEAYVQETGEFPVKGVDGLSNWAYRALRGEGSRSIDRTERKEIQARVRELRATARYVHVRKPDKLLAYVDALEGYIRRNGHLPSAYQDADLRMNRSRLKAALNSPSTDDITRSRITAILNSTPYAERAAAA